MVLNEGAKLQAAYKAGVFPTGSLLPRNPLNPLAGEIDL